MPTKLASSYFDNTQNPNFFDSITPTIQPTIVTELSQYKPTKSIITDVDASGKCENNLTNTNGNANKILNDYIIDFNKYPKSKYVNTFEDSYL